MQNKRKKTFDIVRRQKNQTLPPHLSRPHVSHIHVSHAPIEEDFNFYANLSPEERHLEAQRIRSKIFQNTQKLQEAQKQREGIERVLIAKGKKREELQYAVVQLVDAAADIQAQRKALYSDVKKRLAEARRSRTRALKKIEKLRVREKDIQDLLLGLKIRVVKNRIEYFSWFRRQYDRQLQIKMSEQQKLEKEISVLQARFHGILFKIRATEREEEKKTLLAKRRGRVIAGNDLSTIASYLAQFQTTTQEVVQKEKAVQSQRELIRAERKHVIGQLSYLRHKVVSLNGKIERRYEQRRTLEKIIASLSSQLRENEHQKQKAKIQPIPQPTKPKLVAKKPTLKKKPVFVFDFSFRKTLLQPAFISFMILALLITSSVGVSKSFAAGLVLKQRVLGDSTTAYNRITDAKTALAQNDLSTASASFEEASSIFANAESLTYSLSSVAVELSGYLPQTSALKSGSSLLTALRETTAAATSLTHALSETEGAAVIDIKGVPQKKESTTTLTEALARAHADFSDAAVSLQRANDAMKDVRIEDIPENLRDKVEMLQQGIPVLATLASRANGSYETLLALLGSDHARRYLLLFQNHTELRATGGFLGTYALVDIDQGKITSIKTDGIYNLDGQLAERIIPPYPLRLITDRWFARDANWYPDFPSSAKKISELFEKSGGPSFDGIISFTPTIVEDLLKLTGPITMKKYDATVTSKNFIEKTQYEVEKDYDKKLNRPKQFLADLLPVLLSETMKLNKSAWPDIISVFLKAAGEKHLLAYSTDRDLQRLIEENDLSGEMIHADGDYLSIINSNILGNKTDAMIREDIKHVTTVETDGSLVDTVTVTRKHTGTRKWPSGTNRDYIRIYVPQGSNYVHSEGFSEDSSLQKYVDCNQCSTDPDVSAIESTIEPMGDGVEKFSENGFTVFAGWQILEPGTSETYSITYKLPDSLKKTLIHPVDSYRLLVQKQAGSLGSTFTHETQFDQHWKVIKNIVDDSTVVSPEPNVVRYETTLTTDKFFSHIIEKR